jgi:hypothetical protein
VIRAASFRRTLFLTRVSKGTERFLMRRLASLIYSRLLQKYRVSGYNKIWVNGRLAVKIEHL